MTWEHWIVFAILGGAAFWLLRRVIKTVHAAMNPSAGAPACLGCPGKTTTSSNGQSLITKPLVQIGAGLSSASNTEKSK